MFGLMSKKDLLSVCCQGLTGKKNYIYLQTGKHSTVFKIGNASDENHLQQWSSHFNKSIINRKIHQNTSTTMTRCEKNNNLAGESRKDRIDIK